MGLEVSLHCPHCGEHTAASAARLEYVPHEGYPGTVPVQHSPLFYSSNDGLWWLAKCNACEEPILVLNRGDAVLPVPQPGPVSEDIPEPMWSDLREAKQCLAAGAYNAAAVMARRALQCAAVEQGASKGKLLWQQIQELDEKRIITAKQRKWAEAARWIGNHGAHDTEPKTADGDPVITEVTKEDANDTIDLVEHLFAALYVADRAAEKQLAKRGKTKR